MRITLLPPPHNGLLRKCNAYTRKLSLDSIVVFLDYWPQVHLRLYIKYNIKSLKILGL
jgi:hypothetical protein